MKRLYNENGINQSTYNLLLGGGYPLDDHFGSERDNSIIRLISLFTMLDDINLKFLNKKQIIGLENISYHGKKYRYKDEEYDFYFNKISNFIKDEDTIKMLQSTERYGKCHLNSLVYAPRIKNSRIVTGYINLLNKKYLHTIIEIERNKKTLILDWTRNLIISKEQYILLTKFQELNVFNSENFMHDSVFLKNIEVGVRFYCLFREELLENLKKNEALFEPEFRKSL